MTALHIGRLCRAVSYELFTYWSPGGTVFPSVKALADGLGLKRRAVRHHLAHLDRVGLWVRIGREDETNLYVLHLPWEAQEGFVKPSPRHAHAPPGTHMPPEVTNEVIKEVISTSSRAREVCKICGNDWPSEYGTKCHKCGHIPSTWTPGDEPKADDKPTDEPKGRTCGDAYHNSYGRRCVDCEGEPSAAQRDALQEKDGGGVHTRGGVDGGGLTTPQCRSCRRQTNARRLRHVHRRNRRTTYRLTAANRDRPTTHRSDRRFFADLAQWTVGKRTPTQHRSDRRRMARTARQELADLAKGEQADDGHTTT